MSNLDWNYIIGQIISVIVLILSAIVTSCFKNINYILVGEVFMNLLIALSYVFLGGLSGAWVCIVATIQTVILFFCNKIHISQKKRNMLIVIFLAAYVVGTVIVYKGLADSVSCFCAFLYVLAIVSKKSSNYRWFMMLNSFFWIIYDISVAAWVAILTHGITLISCFIGKIRFDWKKSNN